MGGPNSTRWRGHQRKHLVEQCLALDLRDLGQLEILSSPSPLAGRFDWKASPAGTLLGSATYWLGPLGNDDTRELRLCLGEELDPSGHVQAFKLERVTVGCAPRWLQLCPQCGEHRARRLFLPAKSKQFACKRCHNLIYRSVAQHDQRVDRIARRLRTGDLSLLEEHNRRGRKPGFSGFCGDRLLLSGLLKAFPEA